MKKYLYLMFSIMLIASALTGCGEKEERQDNLSENGSADVEENQMNGSEEEKLIVTGYDENKVIINFTDERMGKLLSVQSIEKGYTIKMRFRTDDSYIMYLNATDNAWYAYPQAEGDAEPEWFHEGDMLSQSIDGNTISWEITSNIIYSLLKQCNIYEVSFSKENQEDEMIAEGQIKSVEGDK